ncbi:hypothetical protein BBJ28_00021494 [Nothophytophthora sp. Chile5]|nr:hypothetical protein BBJ28_00021494 [Nothophytophthora sp. Chile5]
MSSTTSTLVKMKHCRLGDSGLFVSKLGLGSWMDYSDKFTVDAWYEMMKIAFKNGINFFDTAEVYGSGQAEELMGGAIKQGIADGVWAREDLVLTTKIFLGYKGFTTAGPNDQGVSRKHVIEGTKASLRRLQQDYVDVIFCHRSDPHTPMEETVCAMNFVIEQGWAFYWGTSEWVSSEIIDPCEIADRLGLIRPIVEQSQYNVFVRSRVEFDFVNLYKKYDYGVTVWSPLALGTLTGKYSAGTPENSRFADPEFAARQIEPPFEERVEKADKLKPIAEEVGCTLPQLALAWCVSNDKVSMVIIGASRPSQLENLKALAFVAKVTPEVKAKIDAVVNFVPTVPEIDWFAKLRDHHLE